MLIRKHLNDSFTIDNKLDTSDEIDISINHLTQSINSALDSVVLKVVPSLAAARLPLQEIIDLIRERNKFRK